MSVPNLVILSIEANQTKKLNYLSSHCVKSPTTDELTKYWKFNQWYLKRNPGDLFPSEANKPKAEAPLSPPFLPQAALASMAALLPFLLQTESMPIVLSDNGFTWLLQVGIVDCALWNFKLQSFNVNSRVRQNIFRSSTTFKRREWQYSCYNKTMS